MMSGSINSSEPWDEKSPICTEIVSFKNVCSELEGRLGLFQP